MEVVDQKECLQDNKKHCQLRYGARNNDSRERE